MKSKPKLIFGCGFQTLSNPFMKALNEMEATTDFIQNSFEPKNLFCVFKCFSLFYFLCCTKWNDVKLKEEVLRKM